MSLWFRTRDKEGTVHYVLVPFEPLSFVALVGIAVLLLLPFLQMFRAAVATSPVSTAAVILSVLLVGATLFTLAKLSVIRSVRLVSFGRREMSRTMRYCYFVGYVLLAIGAIAVLLFIAAARADELKNAFAFCPRFAMHWRTLLRKPWQRWFSLRLRGRVPDIVCRVRIDLGDRSSDEILNEGYDARIRHEPEVAHDLFVAAYTLARKQNDIAGQGQSLVALADNALHFYPCKNADLFDVRERLSDHALALFRQIGDERGVAAALRVRASVAADKHGHALLKESLAICERIGDVRGVISSLSRLGSHTALDGDAAEATDLKRKALGLARDLGDQELTAELLFSLAIAFEGTQAEHLSLLEEAQSIYERLERSTSQARCLQLCAQLACEETDWERKAEYLERAVLVARESGDASTLCTSLDLLIDAHRQQGNLARAETLDCERQSLHDPFEISDEVMENLEQAFSAGDADIAQAAVRKWIFGAAK